MSYETEVGNLLKKNLKDIRNIGPLLHLRSLLSVETVAGELHYRFKDTDGNEIKDLDALIALIKDDSIELDRVRVNVERYTSSLTGVRIKLTNVIMKATDWRAQDSEIRREFGVGEKNPVFILSYKLDKDEDLPLKLNYIDFEDYRKEKED